MRNYSSSWLLGLCIALAACQNGNPRSVIPATAPMLSVADPVLAAEEARLLGPLSFWPNADRLLVDPSSARGLQVLDRQNQVLAELPGRFESLDHRADAEGLLVATIDKKRQQAMMVQIDGQQRWGVPHYVPKTAFAIEGLCLYRDSARNDFVFLLGEEGVGEQWLVAANGRPLPEARRVRGLSLPPESEFCQVDDSSDSLYISEERVGLWRYDAGAEAALVREPVDMRAPFGGIAKAAAGLALVPGGLLVLDPKAGALHVYQQQAQRWALDRTFELTELDEPEKVSARVTSAGVDLLLVDERGARYATLDWTPKPVQVDEPMAVVMPLVGTDPVPSLGDAADDPAIWVNPRDRSQSRVLGTDKQGGLLVYDLKGRQLQDLRVGRLNNVDLRTGFNLGGATVDLAVASNRDHNSLHFFAIDPATGVLRDIGQTPTSLKDIYGMCLFKDASGAVHAFVNDKDGTFLQYRLSGVAGKPSAELVRRFRTQTQPEGCVADDRRQRLYVGEEDVAVWTLDARAEAPAELEQVIAAGGVVKADIEGLALYHGKARDYLVISSQGNDSYVVLDATAPYAVRGRFRVGLNAALGIDGASETDGLEVTSANLGGPWRDGMLVVQDGRKRMPEANQNYKYVPWTSVADALGLE
ncbi:phytase [Stutzerimonas zhaodongensis]|uniref:phytase n=1 Tax=Stutzerimonas TaxID=2901164 RepID=UPI00388FB98A